MKRILAIIGIWALTVAFFWNGPAYAVGIRARVPEGGTGMSSTSPNSILVTGNSPIADFTATSSDPLWVARINATSTSATSTFANGIDLTGGCFKTPAGCLTAGFTGGGSANQVTYWSGATALTGDANFIFDGTNLGIGTTTPGSLFSVGSVANFRIGTSTIYSGLELPGLKATSTGITISGGSFLQTNNATNTFAGGLSITAGGLRILGDGRIDNLNLTGNFIFGGSTFTDLSGDATIDTVSGALRVVDVTCTDCLNATEIEDIYLFNNANDTTTGELTAARYLGSGTATSSLTGGLTTTVLDASLGIKTSSAFANTFHATSTTATSTFAGGISLSGGCFANTAGDCMSGKISPSVNIASTTLSTAGKFMSNGTTTFLLKNSPTAFTLEGYYCQATSTVASTQFATLQFADATGNKTTLSQCNTTGSFTSLSSNNTWTSFEPLNIEIASQAQIDRVTITTQIRETSD